MMQIAAGVTRTEHFANVRVYRGGNMNAMPAKEISVLMEIAETKRIHSAIEKALPNNGSCSIVVTSAARKEGKTLTTATLAALAAQHKEAQVLAVDLNWYSPALHLCFGLEQKFGPARLQPGSIMELVQPSGLSRLDILTAPKLDSPEDIIPTEQTVLGIEIIREALSNYNRVFVDTSSIFPTNRSMMDPVLLAAEAHGTVLVVLANVTARQVVKRSHFMLENLKAKVLGVVVNQCRNPLG